RIAPMPFNSRRRDQGLELRWHPCCPVPMDSAWLDAFFTTDRSFWPSLSIDKGRDLYLTSFLSWPIFSISQATLSSSIRFESRIRKQFPSGLKVRIVFQRFEKYSLCCREIARAEVTLGQIKPDGLQARILFHCLFPMADGFWVATALAQQDTQVNARSNQVWIF